MDMMRESLSLCMIVKNEEKHLELCLNSVKGYVNEIIIVDTGSTDDTKRIASEFTEKIFDYKWIDDFSAARNYAISLSNCEYILILDADEVIENPDEIKEAIRLNKDVYLFTIKNTLSNGGSYSHIAYRMFRNHLGLKFENRLHEHLNIESIPNLAIGRSNALINHVGYTAEITLEKDKNKRNLELIKKEARVNPTDYNIYNLGRSYFTVGDYPVALRYFQKSYQMNHDRPYIPDLIAKMGLCLLHMKKFEDGLRIVQDALNLYPNEVDLLFLKGELYMEIGYLKDAEISFNKCIELGDRGYQVTEGYGSFIAKLKLAEIFLFRGEILQAFNLVISAIQERKNYLPGIIKYFEITTLAEIPDEDVMNTLQAIYPIINIKELSDLLDILYNLRHPLLLSYLQNYNVNVKNNIFAVAHLYGGEYDTSLQYWNKLSNIKKENNVDRLLLSAITPTESDAFVSSINLNKKEKAVLRGIISRSGIVENMSENLAEMVIELSAAALNGRNDTLFRYLYGKLMAQSVSIKYKMAEKLFALMKNEEVVSILTAVLEQNNKHTDSWRMLGDTHYRMKNYKNALECYQHLAKADKTMPTFERLYNVNEKLGLLGEMAKAKMMIVGKFPLTEWANE
jgi:glycosyltransferase involved in cell wall biosynthesis